MKLIDFALIFSCIFLCFIAVDGKKNDLLYENTLDNIMYNNAVDEITYDALKAGFFKVDENGEPIVDKELLSERLLNEMSLLYSTTSSNAIYSADYLKAILVLDSGFYAFTKGKWSDYVLFSNKENTKHEAKVVQILEYISKSFGNELYLAINDGEKYKNTICDFSLLCIYQNRAINIDDNLYQKYFISGAAIVKSNNSKVQQ